MEKYDAILQDSSGRYKKFLFLSAGVGFLLGILIANTFGSRIITELGIFGDYFFMQIANVEITGNAMFWYVFEKRMLFVVFVLALGMTNFGTAAVCAVAGWIGSSLGFLLSAAAMQQGIGGVCICMAALLPHYILYIPAGVVLFVKVCKLSRQLHSRDVKYSYFIKKDLMSYLLAVVVVIVIFFVGILLESYVAPKLLYKFYKIFNNI